MVILFYVLFQINRYDIGLNRRKRFLEFDPRCRMTDILIVTGD